MPYVFWGECYISGAQPFHSVGWTDAAGLPVGSNMAGGPNPASRHGESGHRPPAGQVQPEFNPAAWQHLGPNPPVCSSPVCPQSDYVAMAQAQSGHMVTACVNSFRQLHCNGPVPIQPYGNGLDLIQTHSNILV